MRANGMEDFGRPRCHENVRHRSKTDSQSIAQRLRKVGTLGVPTAGHLLQVWESRAVFQVQEGCIVDGPRDEVRASGELVVLIRLVDADLESDRAQVGCLDFAHEDVYGVLLPRDRSLTMTRINDPEFEPKSQRHG